METPGRLLLSTLHEVTLIAGNIHLCTGNLKSYEFGLIYNEGSGGNLLKVLYCHIYIELSR